MIMEDDGWIGGEGVTGWEYGCMGGLFFNQDYILMCKVDMNLMCENLEF